MNEPIERVASYARMPLGAAYLGEGRCSFNVWAPFARDVHIHVMGTPSRMEALRPQPKGYHCGILEDVRPGTPYRIRLHGQLERPDPASKYQPEGVHGSSQVVDSRFDWTDQGWYGIPLREYIVYELHVGTFTREGTFDAAAAQLKRLADLGITAIELMPVAQFPGRRNWGYDGVDLYAVQNSYGGPDGLRRFVDVCHGLGLAVILDVVYNHLGPEGNYLAEFGPYFTDRYKTPWGAALNFDGAQSDEVRRFFIENALYWMRDFHVDAFRFDAVHAITDVSARPFLAELTDAIHNEGERLNRRAYCIAETDANDLRFIRPTEQGGFGFDAQWNDEFHHALRTLLTGQHMGYFADYGSTADVAKAMREGYVYAGAYSAYRQRRFGVSSKDAPASAMMVFIQNHDQVGNPAAGKRLHAFIGHERIKLAAAAVILSPYLPLLFMGEEYGEVAPFYYFVEHGDSHLVEAVRQGRKREFQGFRWAGEPPDPQAEDTFKQCILDPSRAKSEAGRRLLDYYRTLIALRKSLPSLHELEKERMEVYRHPRREVLSVHRWAQNAEGALLLLHFDSREARVTLPIPPGRWRKKLDSTEQRWGGPGAVSADELQEGDDVLLGGYGALLYERAHGAERNG